MEKAELVENLKSQEEKQSWATLKVQKEVISTTA